MSTSKSTPLISNAQVLATAQAWLEEEVAELQDAIDAGNHPGQLDALFDALGVILCALDALPKRRVDAAHAAYVNAQAIRGRDVLTPHHLAITAAIDALSSSRGASDTLTPRPDSKSCMILRTKWIKITGGEGEQ
jgi:methylphosphotriester-DNA--protein-cysteine methyltransferase